MIERAIMSYAKKNDVIFMREIKYTRSQVHCIQNIEKKKMKC